MQSNVATIVFDWYCYSTRVRVLAEAAVDAGHMVDVICLRQPQEKSFEVCNGVNIYRVPMSRRWDQSFIVTILSWCWFLLLAGFVVTWLHLKHHYDVIHVHNMPDFLVFSALFPKLLKAKIILDVQDASPELMTDKAKGHLRWILKHLTIWQERFSTTFADHVMTIGWTVEEVLLQRGVPREKLTSVLNSVDPRLFPPSSRFLPLSESSEQTRPFILMFHGTVAERQGLDTAVRALALARHVVPQVQLHIKGAGDQLPVIKKLAVELGVSEHVNFSDLCPIQEVVNFVMQGDIGIIPYQNGGYMEMVLPVKAFEFAWMYRPMIASDTRGMRSLFRPESVAFCDSTKPEDFAKAIIDLYQHPEKRTSLAVNAAEDYAAYSWEKQAECYQELLAFLSIKKKQRQNKVVQGDLYVVAPSKPKKR